MRPVYKTPNSNGTESRYLIWPRLEGSGGASELDGLVCTGKILSVLSQNMSHWL